MFESAKCVEERNRASCEPFQLTGGVEGVQVGGRYTSTCPLAGVTDLQRRDSGCGQAKSDVRKRKQICHGGSVSKETLKVGGGWRWRGVVERGGRRERGKERERGGANRKLFKGNIT